MAKMVMASFDHGPVPTIFCANRATVELGVDLDELVAALQVFVDQQFAPVWGTPCKVVGTAGDIPPEIGDLVFTDNADMARKCRSPRLTSWLRCSWIPVSKMGAISARCLFPPRGAFSSHLVSILQRRRVPGRPFRPCGGQRAEDLLD